MFDTNVTGVCACAANGASAASASSADGKDGYRAGKASPAPMAVSAHGVRAPGRARAIARDWRWEVYGVHGSVYAGMARVGSSRLTIVASSCSKGFENMAAPLPEPMMSERSVSSARR